MILGKVRVQNFKSIKDTGWIHLSKGDLINILAGQNESGKTSLLRALKFFQEGQYNSFEEEDRRMEESPRVDCTFYLTTDEYEDLKDITNKKIADYFKINGFNFVRGDIQKDNFNIRYTTFPDIQKDIDELNSSLDEEAKKFDAFEYFESIKPDIVFYSSFSDNILPGKIFYNDLPNNQAIKDFEKIYKIDFQDLLSPAGDDKKRTREEERIRKNAAESLNNYWNQTIAGEDIEYKFAISIRPDSNITSGYVNFYINQGDEPQLSISQKSQGFQWFAGFNLRLRAHQESIDSNGLILLIDEPGQGLHEIAQEDVKNVIEELAKDSKIQIIYSTHQPVLLGKENIDFSRLLLVERTNEEGSKFKTISQLVSSNGARDSLSPIRSAIGLVSINNLSSDKTILITEGITEYFYLKTILDNNDYIIIPSAGVDQIPSIYAILFGWGFIGKTLVDDDTQGKKIYNKIKKEFFNDQESDEFKSCVLKITGKTGIEELLGIDDIKNILSHYSLNYDDSKTKLDNISQIGKFIFAKSFFDIYKNNLNVLTKETTDNFKIIQDFL